MEQLNFILNNQMIDVKVQRTNNRHTYLRVKNTQIILLIPKKAVLNQAKSFVQKHLPRFVDVVNQEKSNQKIDLNNKIITVGNKQLLLKIYYGFESSYYELTTTELIIKCSIKFQNKLEMLLNIILKQILQDYLIQRVRYYEKKMHLKMHQIKVVNKETNWGSNILRHKTLSFATKLVHFSNEVIDYVIIHELAHDLEPNHSKSFWKIVKVYCPNYQLIKSILKPKKIK